MSNLETSSTNWQLVVSAYLDESISLGKAAELLEIHPVELREIFLAKGIPLRLGPVSKEEAQAEVDALHDPGGLC